MSIYIRDWVGQCLKDYINKYYTISTRMICVLHITLWVPTIFVHDCVSSNKNGRVSIWIMSVEIWELFVFIAFCILYVQSIMDFTTKLYCILDSWLLDYFSRHKIEYLWRHRGVASPIVYESISFHMCKNICRWLCIFCSSVMTGLICSFPPKYVILWSNLFITPLSQIHKDAILIQN